MRSLAISLLVALLPAAALAEKWDYGCTTQTTATTATREVRGSRTITPGSRACMTWVDTAGSDDTTADDSPLFAVTAASALICLDSDIGATAIGAARVDLMYCPTGTVLDATGDGIPDANAGFACQIVRAQATALDGTEGAASTQNACIRVGPGSYYLDLTTIPAAGSLDTARVVIQGEETLGE